MPCLCALAPAFVLRTFPRINAVLSVGGLASLVVARLDDPTLDSASRLALLKILKVLSLLLNSSQFNNDDTVQCS